jgi:hypothetical protein
MMGHTKANSLDASRREQPPEAWPSGVVRMGGEGWLETPPGTEGRSGGGSWESQECRGR